MRKKYKVSMFCLYIKLEGNRILLYNSLKGKRSLNIKNNASTLLPWLDRNVEYDFCNDMSFKWLVTNGYLVECTIDEKVIRDAKKAKFLEDKCLYLTIHVTQNCNFRCVYCSNSFSLKSISDDVQRNVVELIKRNIHNYSGIYVSWFGGEPLLEIDIIEKLSRQIMAICQKVKKPYFSDITTNGFLLSSNIFKRLINCNVREICVTLDGDRETHNKMRVLKNGGNTYKRIIDNLYDIKTKFVKEYYELVIRVNLSKQNINNFVEYYNLYDELFGDSKHFSLYLKIVRNWGGDKINMIQDELISDDQIWKVYREYASNKKELRVSGCFEQLEFGGLSCMSMKRNSLVVYPNGKVGKCEKMEVNNFLGNIEDTKTIFNDEMFEMWNGIAYRINEKCDNCALSTICFGSACTKDKLEGKSCECENTFSNVYSLLKFYEMLNKEGWNEKN